MVRQAGYTSYYITIQNLFENYSVIGTWKCRRYRGKSSLEIQLLRQERKHMKI